MTSSQQLTPFTFPETSREIRVVEIGGEPWFVAVDVCGELGLTNASMAMQRLDADEYKQVAPTLSATVIDGPRPPQRPVNVVSESGLYSLILWSTKPEAKRFKKWITSEVLPSIRKTGSYGAPAVPQTFAEALQLAADSQREIDRQAAQLAIAAPKVDAYDAHVDSEGGITIKALAKQLIDDGYQLNCKNIYRLLNTVGIIYRQGDTWVPYETSRREGLAISRMDLCANGVHEVVLLTPAGVLAARQRLSHLRSTSSHLM